MSNAAFSLQKEASGTAEEVNQPKEVDGINSATPIEKTGEAGDSVKVDPVDIEKVEQIELQNAKDLEKLNKELTKEVEELEKAEKLEQTERGAC